MQCECWDEAGSSIVPLALHSLAAPIENAVWRADPHLQTPPTHISTLYPPFKLSLSLSLSFFYTHIPTHTRFYACIYILIHLASWLQPAPSSHLRSSLKNLQVSIFYLIVLSSGLHRLLCLRITVRAMSRSCRSLSSWMHRVHIAADVWFRSGPKFWSVYDTWSSFHWNTPDTPASGRTA